MRRYVIRQEIVTRVFDENEKQIGFEVIGGEVAVDIRGRELHQIIDDKANQMASDVSKFVKKVLAEQ